MKLYLSSHTGRDSGKGGLGSAATGGIGSYVLVCMCIAYLVRTKLLDIENVRQSRLLEFSALNGNARRYPPSIPQNALRLRASIQDQRCRRLRSTLGRSS